jgi:glycosyltransferase involved in cell wall biosynthesis
MHVEPHGAGISPARKSGQVEQAVCPRSHVLVVVPVYNHAATLAAVVRDVLAIHPHVLVVDDGSTDLPPGGLTGSQTPGDIAATLPKGHPLCGMPISYVRHQGNQGKGAAIMTGAREAKRLGMTHMVTIDADGQHTPADLEKFLQAAAEDPLALYVGYRDFSTANAPFSSRFGRSFSNFWYTVQSGEKTGDVQSGFRLYPLALLESLRCREKRYSFEVEVLVRAAWAGFKVKNIPVHVVYPPKEKRISHFRPVLDNLRMALLNTRLTIRAIMPVPQKKYVANRRGRIILLRPMQSLGMLLSQNETPGKLALAAMVGMFLGALPLVGLHSVLILLATGALRLNKLTGLAVSQLCLPPFVPALCVEAGHYMHHGFFLTELSLRTLGYEAADRLWEWILGSLLLAPLLSLLVGGLVFVPASVVRRALAADAKTGHDPADREHT